MKFDLLQELEGGMAFWKGRPWWFVLGANWSAEQPWVLASQALFENHAAPEKLAEMLGCEYYFPLTEGKLGRWSLELRRRHLSDSQLPNIDEILTRSRQLPIQVNQLAQPNARRLWAFLLPLLGEQRALNCLHNSLLLWRLWEQRKPWHETAHRTLLDLVQAKGSSLVQAWSNYSRKERVELFLSYFGPGPLNPKELENVADSEITDALCMMSLVWAGPLSPPRRKDVRDYLVLSLRCPDYRFPDFPLLEHNFDRLRYYRDKLDPARLDLVFRLGRSRLLPVSSILTSRLTGDDITFALEHGLEGALSGYCEPELARSYFELSRLLVKAGISPTLLSGDTLVERSGNRYVFCYLLLSRLQQPLKDHQLKALDRLAPGAGFGKAWRETPELSQQLEGEVVYLAELLELPRERLKEYISLRLALGKAPFSKRLRVWLPSSREKEKAHLTKKLTEDGASDAIHKQLQKLDSLKPDKNEKKRCRKEVNKGFQLLPSELWQAHLTTISNTLLRIILGKELLAETPRAAQLLRTTTLPVDKLLLLRAEHPANQAWLRNYESGGRQAAYWLDGLSADFRLGDKFIELRTETRASEVLEMGSHFQTCLSLDGGENAFSTLTNLLEVNKMVIVGRDLNGTLLIRKLIGATCNGELVGYNTYSHLPGAKEPVDRACRAFARRCDLKLSNAAVPERIIKDLDWYDDGPEHWLDEALPATLPDYWPQDRDAVRQWMTLELQGDDPVRDFVPQRTVEFYHQLQRGLRPQSDPQGADVWKWDEALDHLAACDRFDILRRPQAHNTPSEMVHKLSEECGLSTEFADEYVALLNPEHKLYKSDAPHPDSYNEVDLAAVAVFADPKVLRRTCQGLGRADAIQSYDDFFENLCEVLYLAYLRSPNDQAWHRFSGPGLDQLMVAVGTRVAVPQWAATFKKISQQEPDYDEVWLARARVEGSKVASLIKRRLQQRRTSLPLALALHHAGELPQDYILPRPRNLCMPGYLNKARALKELIKPRMQRLRRRGFSTGNAHELKKPDLGSWLTWSEDTHDQAMDNELTVAVLQNQQYEHAAAWARFGKLRLRLGVLWHLQADLSHEQRTGLAIRGSWLSTKLRDSLPLAWLEACGEVDVDDLEDPSFLLSWRTCPFEVEAMLRHATFSNKIKLLQGGAEWVTEEELEELLDVAFEDVTIPLASLGEFLKDDTNSVRLQLMLLRRAHGEPSSGLEQTARGEWAKKLIESRECGLQIVPPKEGA